MRFSKDEVMRFKLRNLLQFPFFASSVQYPEHLENRASVITDSRVYCTEWTFSGP